MEMEKRQIAISCLSKRDKCTLPKHTSGTESESHAGRGNNSYTGSESESCQGKDTNRASSESPACMGETIADQPRF